MMKNIFARIQKFKQAEKGAILIFLALSLLPLLLIVGLATDTGYGLVQKRKIQMAVDAAAKAGAKYGNKTLETVISMAGTMFASNTVNMTGIMGPNISMDSSTGCVTVSASIDVPTTFMALGGIDSVTYNATATSCLYGASSELALLIDLSSTTGNWTSKVLNSMTDLINGLPAETLVSVIPFASDISLSPATTNAAALFNNLSNTTNDESAYPAFYGLSKNYAWNATNYESVYNYLYGATYPTVTSYYPSPGTCTGWGGPSTYLACAILYPGLCSIGHASCSSQYRYYANTLPAILPLTSNRTTILNYINSLVPSGINDVFPSLIVWGWRTLDPNWKNFWRVNENPTDTLRSIGKYPLAYKSYNPKNIVLYTSGTSSYTPSNYSSYYAYPCGSGKTSYVRNYYGVLPYTTDNAANVDITCDNYNYQTMDQALGLNLTTNNYYASTQSFASYGASIQAELDNKFLRICSNIKAKGVYIYIVTQNDNATLKQCASGAGLPYYQVTGNGVPFVNIAATNVSSKIGGGSTATQG